MVAVYKNVQQMVIKEQMSQACIINPGWKYDTVVSDALTLIIYKETSTLNAK
jgi:hypothetical protein